MISASRLLDYMRAVTAYGRRTIAVPPFTLYLNPDDPDPEQSFALPDHPAPEITPEVLSRLRSAFASANRALRLLLIETPSAPDNQNFQCKTQNPALAGFILLEREHILVCTPATLRPVPEVAGVLLTTLDAASPLAEVRAGLDASSRGFDPAATATTTEEAALFRAGLISSRFILARYEGEPVAGGMFTSPRQGVSELVGLATRAPYRGRGIAAALTGAIAQTAFAAGVEAIFLRTDNPTAYRMYERCGFQAVATLATYSN